MDKKEQKQRKREGAVGGPTLLGCGSYIPDHPVEVTALV